MCRSKEHGGRRCRCGQGETRKSYQRGGYARKKVVNLRHPATGRPVWAAAGNSESETATPTPTPPPEPAPEVTPEPAPEPTPEPAPEPEPTPTAEDTDPATPSTDPQVATAEQVSTAIVGRDDLSNMTPEQREQVMERARELYPAAEVHAQQAWETLDSLDPRSMDTKTVRNRTRTRTSIAFATDELNRAQERYDKLKNGGASDSELTDAKNKVDACEEKLADLNNKLIDYEGGQERVTAEREYLHATQRLGGLVSTSVDAQLLNKGAGVGGVDPKQQVENIVDAAVKGTKYPEAVECCTRLHLIATQPELFEDPKAERERVLTQFDKVRAVGKLPRSRGVYDSAVNRGLREANAANDTLDIERDVMMSELGRFGAFGGRQIGKGDIGAYGKVSPKAKKSLNEALAFFPDKAVDEAWETTGSPMVRTTQRRAHFQPSKPVTQRELGRAMFSLKTPMTAESLNEAAEYAENGYHSMSTGGMSAITPRAIHVLRSRRSKEDSDTGRRYMTESTPETREAAQRYVRALNGRLTGRAYRADEYVDDNGKAFVYISEQTPDIRDMTVDFAPEITTDGTLATSVHEMSHFVEHNNARVGTACKRFVDDRTHGVSRSLGSPGEPQAADSFSDCYVSREYTTSTNATEVLSMGMESLFGGGFGRLTGADDKSPADAEHRGLVLGLLASMAKDKN